MMHRHRPKGMSCKSKGSSTSGKRWRRKQHKREAAAKEVPAKELVDVEEDVSPPLRLAALPSIRKPSSAPPVTSNDSTPDGRLRRDLRKQRGRRRCATRRNSNGRGQARAAAALGLHMPCSTECRSVRYLLC